MQKKTLYLFLLIIGTAFWGISFVFVKAGVAEVSPYVFLLYKFFIAAFTLLLVFYSQLKYINSSTIITGVVLGIPLFAGTLLQSVGLQYTSVSNSAFITGLDVLLIPIFKSLLHRKQLPVKIWFSCIMAFGGLSIIAVKLPLRMGIGDVYTIACAFGFAAYVILAGRFAGRQYPILAVIVAMFFCAFGSLLISLLTTHSALIPSGYSFWQGVMFTGLLATAYMYAVQNYGQRYLSEEKVAITYLFEPIFASIASVLLLHETISLKTYIGGFFIILAMFTAEATFTVRKR